MDLARRDFLRVAGGSLAAAMTGAVAAARPSPAAENAVTLPPLYAHPPEAREIPPPPSASPEQRIGFAIVGLGHLTIEQILPAFAQSRLAKVTALVSGDREKARKLGRQHGVPESALYDYANFERLAHDPRVQVVYIVLPNAMHAEYTVRAARMGKHVLCEKPMATSVADCAAMIEACRSAGRLLMIGYRSQYEPLDRLLGRLIRERKLGELRELVTANSQNQGNTGQWRLNPRMAGGGPLPDVGIYCINAARFLSGEEPTEVIAQTVRPKDDPRFREVEASVQFSLKFPSGFVATCSASYDSHKSQFFRLNGEKGWVQLDPAYAYQGLRLRYGTVVDGAETVSELFAPPVNQFALELDHMARCVLEDRQPHTPGEEGLQDQRIVEAIYESARTGQRVALVAPPPTRGPAPEDDPA